MKIKTTHKKQTSLPSTYTRVALIEKGATRVIEHGKIQTLEIPLKALKTISPRKFRILMREIVQTSKAQKISKISLELKFSDFEKLSAYDEQWFWSTVIENLMMADYEFNRYKSKEPKKYLTEIHLAVPNNKFCKQGVSRGRKLGEAISLGRDLANTPGGDLTPALLASKVRTIFKGTKTKLSILNETAIKKLKMGGILGVGQGSKEKSQFIILEYYGAGKGKKTSQKPLVLVGKGITFDTGGLQVKPGVSMNEMHMDMSGGATVIAALKAITDLKLKKNVIGLIPAAENSVGESAIRPGDVITMMSGITVDVLHTDAEGRLVLGDALHYAKRYDPKLIVDVATLTGASVVAVGPHAHAIMTKSRNLEDLARELGEESGDYVTPLPLWDEYRQHIKGINADIANITSSGIKGGGAITAGIFLSYFTEKMKWLHIDMAPRMTSAESDKLSKGATGEPMRLLVKIAEKI